MQTISQTKKTVYCAFLVALSVLLGGALKIPAFLLGSYSMKLSFGVLPVILAGILFGPVYGGIAGGLADFLQASLFPVGAYQPWFSVTGVLFGLLPGLFFMKKQSATLQRILLAVCASQLIGSVLCNTLLISALYNLPIWGILPARMLNQALMIPAYTFLLRMIMNLPQIQALK